MYSTICNIYFDIGFLSRVMSLIQEARDEDFSGCFFSFRQGGSPRMGQIVIMSSYDVEKMKNIAKRLAGIAVEGNYSLGRLEVTTEGIE